MSTSAVIFDLGNTLVSYHTREEWPAVLLESIAEVAECLRDRGQLHVNHMTISKRVQVERGEPEDHRVVLLADRLCRIFDLGDVDQEMRLDISRAFLGPTFQRAYRYDDVLPTLATLREGGMKLGILSNTPWGSPAELWHEELVRQCLSQAVDAALFCVEVGYRKPAPHGFHRIMELLRVPPEQCLFVGDDPRWDLVGPENVGMEAVLIDRSDPPTSDRPSGLRSLTEILEMV